MGKSNQSWDKGVPRRNVKDDEPEDFDWRDVVAKETEEEKAIREDVEMELNKKMEQEDDDTEE